MKNMILIIAFTLSACSEPNAPTATVATSQICMDAPSVALTPAPLGETPLERWRRTKADYERVNKIGQSLRDRTYRLDMPAYRAYSDAEKEMETLECGAICKPLTSK